MVSSQIGVKAEILHLVQVKTFHSVLHPDLSFVCNFSLHNDPAMCGYFQETNNLAHSRRR